MLQRRYMDIWSAGSLNYPEWLSSVAQSPKPHLEHGPSFTFKINSPEMYSKGSGVMKYGSSLRARFLIPLAKLSFGTTAHKLFCAWAGMETFGRITCARKKAAGDGIRAGHELTVDGSGSALHHRGCWHLMDENQAPVSTLPVLCSLECLGSIDEPRD